MVARHTTKKFIQKARAVHGDEYDYSKVDYVNANTKVIIICEEHGEFLQRPYCHLRGNIRTKSGNGCPDCAPVKKSSNTEEFIQKARAVHGNRYDYSKVEYIHGQTKVIIICKEHGEFTQTPNSHTQGHGCKDCNRDARTFSTEEFIQKAQAVHGDKYDYSKVEYIHSHTRAAIICEEHGEFTQTPNQHLRGSGCHKCGAEASAIYVAALRSNTKEFIEKAQAVHGDKYDYSKVEYVNWKTKVIIICKEHGEFLQRPDQHLRGSGCHKCANEILQLSDTIKRLRAAGRNPSGFLYVIECYDEHEHFFKIGITSLSVKKRFAGKLMPYDYDILLEYPMGIINAYGIEQDVIRRLVKCYYEPQIYFGGRSECFSENPIEHDAILQELYWAENIDNACFALA
jgi:hypothetical protein